MSTDPPAKRSRRSVRIGKYEILAHIATGGMGAVYRARDTEQDREVALKVLPPELAANPATLERFRREARQTARLRHDNIVTTHEFGSAAGTWYLALEFVDGVDLGEYIRRKAKLDPAEAMLITRQAASALDHAFRNGIVHRDIKPSNFLLARKDGQLLVKLGDFGLAREMTEDEARVTRDGTTVGTVDYMAPEQARDSGLADTRSDVYSLGCTLFHMLTGRPPFPEGGIGQRVYKHAQEDPPDVCSLAPRVPSGLAAVLRRMLAKKPEDRYQTPADLVFDLDRVAQGHDPGMTERQVLEGLADGDAAPSSRPEKPRAARVNPTPRPRDVEPAAPNRRRNGPSRRGASKAAPRPAAPGMFAALPRQWIVLGGAAALLLLGSVVAAVLLSRRSPSPDTSPAAAVTLPAPPPAPTPPQPVELPPVSRPPGGGTIPPVAPPAPPSSGSEPPRPRSEWPALEGAGPRPDVAALTRDFHLPWQADSSSAPAGPVLRVARLGTPRDGLFPSLNEALVAVPTAPSFVVELHDNGPLYVSPAVLAGKSLVLRAAPGFRPLLVWDTTATAPPSADASAPTALLSVRQGHLTLQGLDLAVRADALPARDRAALVRVIDGDITLDDCSISVAGPAPAGFDVVQLTRADAAREPDRSQRCRLHRCFLRGQSLAALAIKSPGADVLVEQCLVVGHDRPLVEAAAPDTRPPALRFARCTFLAGRTFLHVIPAPGAVLPAARVHVWDCLLAHGGPQAGGDMVVLDAPFRVRQLQWQAVNTLYAGWATLLNAPDGSARDLRDWRVRLNLDAGDAATSKLWPANLPHDPSDLPPDTFRVTPASPVAFAASTGAGPLGADLAAVPRGRDGWLALVQDGFVLSPGEIPVHSEPPDIPTTADGRYHGGRVDLSRTDLATLLEEKRQAGGLGPRVVLHLTGMGACKMRPVKLSGTSLTVWCEPGPDGRPPFLLAPQETAPVGEALFDIDGGDLEMIHVHLTCPDFRLALVPPQLVRVRGGHLHLDRCRLRGPLLKAPDYFRTLVRHEGGSPGRRFDCTLDNCVLASGKHTLRLVGASTFRFRNSILLSGTDALALEPTTVGPVLASPQGVLENVTVAAQGASAALAPAPGAIAPGNDRSKEPLVLQARSCAFLNPFVRPSSPPTWFATDPEALVRLTVLVQGEGNVFDRRLSHDTRVTPPLPDSPTLSWTALWGPAWSRLQRFDLPLTRTFSWDKPDIDSLTVPGSAAGSDRKPRPGADMERLGSPGKLLPSPP